MHKIKLIIEKTWENPEDLIYQNGKEIDETIKMFSGAEKNQNITNEKMNNILKNLYETSFFSNVSVNIEQDDLVIVVLFSVFKPLLSKNFFNSFIPIG